MAMTEEAIKNVADSILQFKSVRASEEAARKKTSETLQQLLEYMKELLEGSGAHYSVVEEEKRVTRFTIEGCELVVKIDDRLESKIGLPPDYQRVLNGDKLICGSIIAYRKDHTIGKYVLVRRLLINEDGKISLQYENTRFEEHDKVLFIAQTILKEALTAKVKVCHPKCRDIDIVESV